MLETRGRETFEGDEKQEGGTEKKKPTPRQESVLVQCSSFTGRISIWIFQHSRVPPDFGHKNLELTFLWSSTWFGEVKVAWPALYERRTRAPTCDIFPLSCRVGRPGVWLSLNVGTGRQGTTR